jgi:hypothetical protein
VVCLGDNRANGTVRGDDDRTAEHWGVREALKSSEVRLIARGPHRQRGPLVLSTPALHEGKVKASPQGAAADAAAVKALSHV